MDAWHDILDGATVQRIKTYSAFNDAESKNLMVQTAMEAGYELFKKETVYLFIIGIIHVHMPTTPYIFFLKQRLRLF